MVSAILFDLDNTLIDRNASFRLFAQSSLGLKRLDLAELVELDAGGYGHRERLYARWTELGGDRFSASTFGLALAEFVKPNEPLLHALGQLCEEYVCGIITNGGTQTQVAKWRAAGLDSVIPRDRLWISEEVGYAKPDARIFELACGQLNLKPKDCLYLGDQFEIDIQGAEAAGLSAVHVTSPLTPAAIFGLPDDACQKVALLS